MNLADITAVRDELEWRASVPNFYQPINWSAYKQGGKCRVLIPVMPYEQGDIVTIDRINYMTAYAYVTGDTDTQFDLRYLQPIKPVAKPSFWQKIINYVYSVSKEL